MWRKMPLSRIIMTSAEFIQIGQRIAKVERGYQKPLAKAIGVSTDSVKRYAAGETIPRPIQILMRLLAVIAADN